MPKRLGHGGCIDIPLDLTVEILKKLPTKSLVRFQCVSKLWSSIISSRRDFIDSIMTRSLSQPPRDVHLMYHYNSGKCFLALFSAADMELELVPGKYHSDCQSVRGLICSFSSNLHTLPRFQVLQTHKVVVTVYNPTTRQSICLPELEIRAHLLFDYLLFGYDPIENHYKVVLMPESNMNKICQVFTLGDPTANFWRTIQGVDRPWVARGSVVCINGTIYYLERGSTNMEDRGSTNMEDNRLMSFDVRSEKFDYVDVPKNILTQMDTKSVPINYQGKVGFLLYCEKGLDIWVMERRVWSKIFFCEMEGFQRLHFSGATHGGEIVFYHGLHSYWGDSTLLLRVFYYDPNRNSMRCVDLEDYYKVDGNRKILLSNATISVVLTVPDYVENTIRLK